MRQVLTSLILPLIATAAPAQKLATFDGVTFANTGPSKIYFPIRELSKHLGWTLTGSVKALKLNGHSVPGSTLRSLPDGTRLVDLDWLKKAGAIVNHPGSALVTVKDAKHTGNAFYVRRGVKRVFINKKEQMLIAYQGQRTVLRTNVSTGRRGKETPLGLFKATYKEKMHKSKLYHMVPMPWSVHVVGNVFVHGFKSTPANASSGCIRVPLSGSNPAEWFYYWTEIGTPISILGKWPKGALASK
jgi:hypothetical protein